MQNELKSPSAGTVATVHVEEGAAVETGAKRVEVKPVEASWREISPGAAATIC